LQRPHSRRSLGRHLNHADVAARRGPHDCIRAGRPSQAPPSALAQCHVTPRGSCLLFTRGAIVYP
jgi:hypothetical protein